MVVEDDPEVAKRVANALETSGFTVTLVGDGEGAVTTVRRVDPDLVVLATQLPDIDGIEVCRRLSAVTDAYIMMISDSDDEVDVLLALEVGADDFVVWPVTARRLRARVSALLRRPRSRDGTAAEGSRDVDLGGGLVIRPLRREVLLDGRVVPVTRTEFDMLVHLARNAGRVCSRANLVRDVWDTSYVDDTHVVEVHVANLRRKLAALSPHPWIRTVRGVGYLLDPVT